MARNASNWFEFKGARSSDLGVLLRDVHALSRAEERGEAVEVPGRSGELWLGEGADRPFELRRVCRAPASRLREIAAWLSGSGGLRFSDEPGAQYEARVGRRVDFKRAIPGADPLYEFSVSFTCQPHPLLWPQPEPLILSQPATLPGQGSAPAQPRITVSGAGEVNLMVNGATALIDDLSGSVTLDCEARTAYAEDDTGHRVFAGRQVTLMSDWPTLLPAGEAVNRISWTGNVASVTVEPRWRWY